MTGEIAQVTDDALTGQANLDGKRELKINSNERNKVKLTISDVQCMHLVGDVKLLTTNWCERVRDWSYEASLKLLLELEKLKFLSTPSRSSNE